MSLKNGLLLGTPNFFLVSKINWEIIFVYKLDIFLTIYKYYLYPVSKNAFYTPKSMKVSISRRFLVHYLVQEYKFCNHHHVGTRTECWIMLEVKTRVPEDYCLDTYTNRLKQNWFHSRYKHKIIGSCLQEIQSQIKLHFFLATTSKPSPASSKV